MDEMPLDIYSEASTIAASCVERPYNLGTVSKATKIIAAALTAERKAATEAERERLADMLKDPAAVRINYLRGDIACQNLIDEAVAAERERCAKIAEDERKYWLELMGKVGTAPHDACRRIAAAIRGEKP